MQIHRLNPADQLSKPPLLAAGQIHLWTLHLNQNPGEDLLSADERQRAERFKFDLHRRRYVARRTLMRKILSGYTGIPANELVFTYNPYDKPLLPDGPVFNLSHSEDLALLAVTVSGALGVDVERVKPLDDLVDLARMNFTEAEMRAFENATSDKRLLVFYDYWTRKEAILKAMGTGLSVPAKAVEAYGDAWQVRSLQTESGFMAAVAYS